MRILIASVCVFVAGLFCGTGIRYHIWRARSLRDHRTVPASCTALKRRLGDEKLHSQLPQSVPRQESDAGIAIAAMLCALPFSQTDTNGDLHFDPGMESQ